MKMFHLLLIAALTGACGAAFAQWQWIDKDGRKIFSDRAPPADILDKSIVKRPAGRTPSAPPPQENTDSADAAAPVLPASGSKVATIDRELEAKKKQAADAEVAKRTAEAERVTKAKVENCARAKQGKTSFDSGIRIARTNAAGEREIMDDAARAAEAKRIQGIIDTDCK